MHRSHLAMCVSLSFLKRKKNICGLSLIAESRVQKTELLFANHRAHASPNCRMSLSASAEPPLCVMSSKAIFGCSPSIFDRKPRSKVEIPLLRDCRRHCIFGFSFPHSDFTETTTKYDCFQAVCLSLFWNCCHANQSSTQDELLYQQRFFSKS